MILCSWLFLSLPKAPAPCIVQQFRTIIRPSLIKRCPQGFEAKSIPTNYIHWPFRNTPPPLPIIKYYRILGVETIGPAISSSWDNHCTSQDFSNFGKCGYEGMGEGQYTNDMTTSLFSLDVSTETKRACMKSAAYLTHTSIMPLSRRRLLRLRYSAFLTWPPWWNFVIVSTATSRVCFRTSAHWLRRQRRTLPYLHYRIFRV